MIDATVLSALGVALVAGIATFFSPCAYPLLPGYVAFYVNQTDGTPTGLPGSLARGLVAGFGVFVALLAVLGTALFVGREAVSNLVILEPLVGVVLVVFGVLVLFDRVPSVSMQLPKRRGGVLGFGVFGAGYALAAAGCVLPIVVGVLATAVSLPLGSATLVLGTYVGTVVGLMIAVTVATGVGLLAGGGLVSHHTGTLKRVAGAVMIIAGIGQLYLAIFVLEAI